MYSNYFGLTEPPFAIAPDPRFLFMSEQHREALAHLMYGINSNGGFVLLTGEVGTGKTTVSRCLLEQLPEDTEVAFILNPKFTDTELLAAICDDLGIPCDTAHSDLKDYVDAINAHLLNNYRQGKHTVLIIDEAQNLSADVLETIRLLTNLETNTQKLLQIILIGQPELLDKLTRPELRQVNQRITARYHLRALSREELPAYIAHRLSVAGVDGQLFPQSTIKRLYKLTGGVPRLVNIVCDRALLGAYVQRENRVEVNTLGKAADEVFGQPREKSAVQGRKVRHPLMMAAMVVLGLLVSYGVYVGTAGTLIWAQGERTTASIGSEGGAQAVLGALIASAGPASSGHELSNPANWQWPEGADPQLSQIQAYQALFSTWGVAFNPREHPAVCSYAETMALRCLFNIDSLDQLINLNRPAVIKLFNAKGQQFYATLTEVNNGVATIALAGELRYVSLDDLKLWLVGQYTLLWRKPEHYQTAIQPGTEGPEVVWLDRQLALSQGRAPRYFRLQNYDSSLVRQVKRFQASNGLAADGVVGPHTAILLNALSETDSPELAARRGGG